MVGVSGQIAYKKVNKNTILSLDYNWESYKYRMYDGGRYRYRLEDDSGETCFYIVASNPSDPDDNITKRMWVFEGGGTYAFDNNPNAVPQNVLDAWNKELSMYRKQNEKKLKKMLKQHHA